MAWYDNILQRGTNYFTGNNLTSQDPNVQNAMAKDARGVNNQLQQDSFSDRSYEDTEFRHPPRSHSGLQSVMPHDVGNWRRQNAINYGSTYPEAPFQPNMANVSGEVGEYGQQPGHGIMATDEAQKKGWNLKDFMSKLPLPSNILRSFKDSPQEKFNRETFSTYGGGPMENRIAKHPMSSVFGNMNVSSLYGGLDTGGQKRIDRLSKAIEKMEGPGGDATKGKWSKLYQGSEEDRAEYERRLGVLKDRKILFANQLKQYNADLAAKGIKEKAAADQPTAAQQQVAADRAAGSHSSQVQMDPGRDTWHGQTAAKERQGQSVAGPGFGKGSYFNQGGRVRYANGDMVAQETDFIEGPQGGEEFQETVVQGQEQPSREQLEALAMEIFQLPLEELDEQQLLVVYQEAMQGQPMEEAVEEQDVQFAAQGGLAGLL